ncbi:hypothetical protein NECAME_15837, partial [Necator americanus]
MYVEAKESVKMKKTPGAGCKKQDLHSAEDFAKDEGNVSLSHCRRNFDRRGEKFQGNHMIFQKKDRTATGLCCVSSTSEAEIFLSLLQWWKKKMKYTFARYSLTIPSIPENIIASLRQWNE